MVETLVLHTSNKLPILAGSTKDFWVGITDILEEKQWRYQSDNTLVSWGLPTWSGVELPTNINKNCAWVRRGNQYRTDSSCSNHEYVICESKTEGKY